MALETRMGLFKEDIVLANGPTNPVLGSKVAEYLGVPIVPTEYRRFADSETYFRYESSVRGKHVIAFQTHAPVGNKPISDSLYVHEQMIDAAIRGHATKVTAVAPSMAGARQDRQVLPREAVSAEMNMRKLQLAGASHFVTVDIHDQHTLNAFAPPNVADQLTAQPLLRSKLAELMVGRDVRDFLMVSPDEGHSKEIRKQARALGVDLLGMVKDRDPNEEKVTHEGNIRPSIGKICLMMDDMIGTAGTIISAADQLHQAGAIEIHVAATHGWFSGDAAEKLAASPIRSIFVTDTLPIRDKVRDRLGDKLVVVSAAELIADGLREMLSGGSVSGLYGGENFS
jgi:ribose-phosphate pyrophosphokinase